MTNACGRPAMVPNADGGASGALTRWRPAPLRFVRDIESMLLLCASNGGAIPIVGRATEK